MQDFYIGFIYRDFPVIITYLLHKLKIYGVHYKAFQKRYYLFSTILGSL